MKARWFIAALLAALGLVGLVAAAGYTGASVQPTYAPTPRPTEICDIAEPNGDWDHAYGPLAPGAIYRFPIRCTSRPDQDFYYFDLEVAGTVTMDLGNIAAGRDYDLYLYDSDHVLQCKSDQYSNTPEHAACPISQTGRYYVIVYDRLGCSDQVLYQLSVFYPTPIPPILTPAPTPICSLDVDDYQDTDPKNNLKLQTGVETHPAGCGSLAPVYDGFDLSLTYDLTAQPGCVAHYTSDLALDASEYGTLSVEVKGSSAAELANAAIGLRDTGSGEKAIHIGDILGRVVTGTWQAVNLPLAAFSGDLDLKRVDHLFVQFAGTQGQVRLDNLRLERSLSPLTVDNFNDLSDPNALGETPGIFSSPAATLQADYVSGGTFDGSPGSLALSYAIPGTWALWETSLGGIDVSHFSFLSFYVKGGAGGEKVNLYLDDGSTTAKYVDLERYARSGAITTDWSPVSVPLSAYPGLDLSDLDKIKFTFEWEPMSGTVYIDNLQFARSQLPVDSFCGGSQDNNRNNNLNGRVGTFVAAWPCTSTIDPVREAGALRLDYDVSTGAGCYAGYYSSTALDYALYRTLTARVKGEGYAYLGAIGVDTTSSSPTKLTIRDYLPAGLTDEWQEISIPLPAMSGATDWPRGSSYIIAFEHDRGARAGTLLVDDVRLETRLAPLWVDNFDDEDDRNGLRGAYETYTGGGAQIASHFVITNSYGDLGASLMLDYTVPAGQYALWQTVLCGVDLSGYESLAFQIKSERGGERPNIRLADLSGKEGFVNLEDYVEVSTQWRAVNIPLADFGSVDLTRANALKFAIEWEATALDGALYLDDIRFLPSPAADPGPVGQVLMPIVTQKYRPEIMLYPLWDFESGVDGWRPDAEAGRRAVIAVERSDLRVKWGSASMAMVLDLDGGDPNRKAGGVQVDTVSNPPAGSSGPLDLSCQPLSCWIYAPASGAGPLASPGQVYLEVEDLGGHVERGGPVTVPRDQWFEVTLRPSTIAPPGGSKDSGFDPSEIRYIGLYLAAGSGQARYRGKVYVDACGWQEIDP